MGVIRDLSTYFEARNVIAEDELDNVDVESIPEEEPRRHRNRNKTRSPVKPENTGKNFTFKCKSGKKYRRFENANQLMSMAEGDELNEVSIYDFIPKANSAFAQFLMEKETMQSWNEFINCSDDDQWAIIESLENSNKNGASNSGKSDSVDSRMVHPAAFSPDLNFRKIDSDLRLMLKKRRVPMFELARLEQDISNYFEGNPNSVRRYHLPNSYQRLMVHAICQYMNLTSNSFNKDGVRWTKIQNHHDGFIIPTMMLTSYLEQRTLQRNANFIS